ncbi:MAG TPA: class I SAM-dependent methyltransferase [Acidobacteriaceae bacterium]|jgi:SAM-dependent methyltransferase|nr:class I SAM-dependent methyltransferase [Acidobacteriaceae bacterium]
MTTTPAFQISILDHQLQAYLQKHPFADGPDPAVNAAARKAIAAGLHARPAAPELTPRLLSPAETQLSAAEQDALYRLFTQLHLGTHPQRIYRNDFAWEANLVPRAAKNVLVIGCGDGVELLFLRAVLPQAAITAIDYGNTLLPGLQQAVGLRFLQGDMNSHLQSLAREYDLVFSNHTLEHLYTPDDMLALLASLLVPGGSLVSILPMVGKTGVPFLNRIQAAASGAPLHPLDMILLDPGHPWKTNPGDLKQTMERAGFRGVELYQRQNHLSRGLNVSTPVFKLSRDFHVLSNNLLITPVRGLLKLCFRRVVPSRLPKLLFAFDRRLFCSTNKLMNLFAEEVLVIGHTPSV